jgi:ABC-type multidrug transport system ATPase subunit
VLDEIAARQRRIRKVAINNLTFGVPKGECFGFLGINGAGKTTTLGILSGEFPPTSGSAYIDGLSIAAEQSKIRRRIGYCPQFDALFDLLTVREHLELYGRVKGIPTDSLHGAVQNKIKQMDLSAFENSVAGSLSGGNKRKLSVAIATIGEPPIVFLDEPSTGMDPVARRFMWGVISRMSTVDGRCSVILTTHSMEEAEALCTRIGVMVNGRLKCLGSAQHLKTRFGHGLELNIKTQPPSPEELVQSAARAAFVLQGPFNPSRTKAMASKVKHLKPGMKVSSILHSQSPSGSGTGENAQGSVSGVEGHGSALSQRRQEMLGYLEDTMVQKVHIPMILATLRDRGARVGGPLPPSAPHTSAEVYELLEAGGGKISLRAVVEWVLADNDAEHLHTFLVRLSHNIGKESSSEPLGNTQGQAGAPGQQQGSTISNRKNHHNVRFTDQASIYDDSRVTLLERNTARSFRYRIHLTDTHYRTDSPLETSTQISALSTIFARMEENKAALKVAEYSVGQTTLEQIFNQVRYEYMSAWTDRNMRIDIMNIYIIYIYRCIYIYICIYILIMT